jgi:hypothetical protein
MREISGHLPIVGFFFRQRDKILFHVLPDGLDDGGHLILDVVVQAVHLAQDLKGQQAPASTWPHLNCTTCISFFSL